MVGRKRVCRGSGSIITRRGENGFWDVSVPQSGEMYDLLQNLAQKSVSEGLKT